MLFTFSIPLMIFFLTKKFFLMFYFIFWETERDRALAGEGQREREMKQASGSELSVQSVMRGLYPWMQDHDLSRSRMLNRLSWLGTPNDLFQNFLKCLFLRDSMFGEWGVEGERETRYPKQSLCCHPRAPCGAQTLEVMTWADVKHLTAWTTQPPL